MIRLHCSDPSKSKSYDLKFGQKYTVGRKTGDITFPDDASISRLHAELEVQVPSIHCNVPRLIVIDRKSKFGTFVNDGIINKVSIPPNEPMYLKPEFKVRFGLQWNEYQFLYTPPVQLTESEIYDAPTQVSSLNESVFEMSFQPTPVPPPSSKTGQASNVNSASDRSSLKSPVAGPSRSSNRLKAAASPISSGNNSNKRKLSVDEVTPAQKETKKSKDATSNFVLSKLFDSSDEEDSVSTRNRTSQKSSSTVDMSEANTQPQASFSVADFDDVATSLSSKYTPVKSTTSPTKKVVRQPSQPVVAEVMEIVDEPRVTRSGKSMKSPIKVPPVVPDSPKPSTSRGTKRKITADDNNDTDDIKYVDSKSPVKKVQKHTSVNDSDAKLSNSTAKLAIKDEDAEEDIIFPECTVSFHKMIFERPNYTPTTDPETGGINYKVFRKVMPLCYNVNQKPITRFVTYTNDTFEEDHDDNDPPQPGPSRGDRQNGTTENGTSHLGNPPTNRGRGRGRGRGRPARATDTSASTWDSSQPASSQASNGDDMWTF